MPEPREGDSVLVEDQELLKKGEELVRKVDKEARYRTKLESPWNHIVKVVSLALVAYHIYTARFGMPEAFKHRAIHLAFILFLLFIYYPATSKSPKTRPSIPDVILALAGVATSGYLVVTLDAFVHRAGQALPIDYVFAAVCVLLVLEACRRTVGSQLLALVLILLAYALFGNLIPGVLSHRGYSIQRVLYQMYLTTQGIFGIPLGVSATYMILFITLAATLGATGLGKLFNDLALGLAGRMNGGPAKVAVVASALLGTISGGAATNVATTGAFTIPLMKRRGYPSYFAGAVEAAASTGGQLMPPIMGSVAFIMADFLGVPYLRIAAAAAIPAIMYFAAVFFQVDLRARKLGLTGLRKDEIPDVKATLRGYGHMLIPIIVLVTLLIKKFTPMYAGFYTLILCFLISQIRSETRISPARFADIAVNGARSCLSVAAAMASAGFVVGVLGMTGIGLILADNIVALSGGHLIIALLLSLVVSIILGMGLPTTACYVVSSAIAAPILTKMGISAFQAHFFVLYFACLSTVTPPVALAAYVGAGLAGADSSKVGWAAFRLALAGFIVPFFFVYSPVILLIGGTPLTVAWAVATGLLGALLLSVAVEGYLWGNLPIWLRGGFFVSAVTLMSPGVLSDASGFGLALAASWAAYALSKRATKVTAAA